MTLSQLVVLIAKQLDVSTMFERLRQLSTARRDHLKNDILMNKPAMFLSITHPNNL